MAAHPGAGSGTEPGAASAPPTPEPEEAASVHGRASAAGGAPGGSSSGRLPEPQVRDMFNRIAGLYDLMNTAMTAGLHHRWRARAAELAGVGPGSRVLDVATGTGDLALELARRVTPGGEVVGSDFAEVMLARARAKAEALPPALVRPRFEPADALALPYARDSFDAATVGFGVRNFSDLGCGLRELARVVRPGGRVVVLEITTPERAPLSLFYALWFDRLVPVLGRALGTVLRAPSRGRAGGQSAVAEAYSYLPSSVRRFPPPGQLAAEMERAGLGEIRFRLLAGGIIAIHVGTVPGATGLAASAGQG
jgi:demethylmenaquinone methyltransferase / 2-methoxy-6-polyprenyl-1,4-benzoquinol methylase